MTCPLEIHDVSMVIRDGQHDRNLLDSITFHIDAGSITALTGHSGSGKTTLLTIAGLLRRPPSGDVLIAGQPTSALNERARTTLRAQHIAVIYQSANLIPALTALEQLELVGRIRGERRKSVRHTAQIILEGMGITGGAQHRLPRELSGGERQRVGIARALIARPSVLIADEPTAAPDPDRASEIAELIASRTREQGIATLLVSHDATPIRLAERHLLLEGGRVSDAPALV